MTEFEFAQSPQYGKDRLCALIVVMIFLITVSLIMHIKATEVWIWPAAPQMADAREIFDRMDEDPCELIHVAAN